MKQNFGILLPFCGLLAWANSGIVNSMESNYARDCYKQYYTYDKNDLLGPNKPYKALLDMTDKPYILDHKDNIASDEKCQGIGTCNTAENTPDKKHRQEVDLGSMELEQHMKQTRSQKLESIIGDVAKLTKQAKALAAKASRSSVVREVIEAIYRETGMFEVLSKYTLYPAHSKKAWADQEHLIAKMQIIEQEETCSQFADFISKIILPCENAPILMTSLLWGDLSYTQLKWLIGSRPRVAELKDRLRNLLSYVETLLARDEGKSKVRAEGTCGMRTEQEQVAALSMEGLFRAEKQLKEKVVQVEKKLKNLGGGRTTQMSFDRKHIVELQAQINTMLRQNFAAFDIQKYIKKQKLTYKKRSQDFTGFEKLRLVGMLKLGVKNWGDIITSEATYKKFTSSDVYKELKDLVASLEQTANKLPNLMAEVIIRTYGYQFWALLHEDPSLLDTFQKSGYYEECEHKLTAINERRDEWIGNLEYKNIINTFGKQFWVNIAFDNKSFQNFLNKCNK